MPLSSQQISQYHVFLASPGDVGVERQHVRKFFERYNRQTAQLWNARFEVVDWENYSTIGVGRPQELITQQTLAKYRDSLALVIGIMGQRFGSPTGEADSGTEEEFNWAMESHQENGFPEIKWFFRKIDRLGDLPRDPDAAVRAVEQWRKVLTFRKRMQDLKKPVFYTEYPGPSGFRDVFENDLTRWLADSSRPWGSAQSVTTNLKKTTLSPPSKYYENIERDFHHLDIAGIDNDRTFEIPLSDIYVRLRVMFDEDAPEETTAHEDGPIDIQTALLRYPKLVIVGDPGSGKSTFLKYIALMLARSFQTGNSNIALEKLCLPDPLPLPIFLSCWDLADFLKQKNEARLNTLLTFVVNRLSAYGFSVSTNDVDKMLGSGNCCLLFDGLDEVPTDAGRAAVSRLLEDCVSEYGDNRFVITSRIRAYTGDTILKGEFTRCDIQPFNTTDRAEFIRNWAALLFKTSPDDVEEDEGDAGKEFYSLTGAIEENDRIRPLAINPLLLTVIAIVHWNRKRLPEQRVDLYDECVDVLLGQRKEAERIQHNRKISAFDEQREEQTYEKRAWVRKRFAEIALQILSQDGEHDELTKADVIQLLVPRFIDKGAVNEEQAAAQAKVFLDRQELRSGLLVSRRAQSYRFVHLTFQEYLAAWQLSKLDFEKVSEIVQPRLRLAKWFETLQLLGGQWAKESDDKADRYIAWLLDNIGITISEQAPIVALCSNIVRDLEGVAELKPKTRKTFRESLEATLDAIKKGSGISANTQLEILEALGQLGAAVKFHLLDATRSNFFPVRYRAIEMLLPHLSEDELFNLGYILEDRSKEPVKAYLQALMICDPIRTTEFLDNESHRYLDSKFPEAVVELPGQMRHILKDLARKILTRRAIQDSSGKLRSTAFELLADHWPDETTRKFLTEQATKNSDGRPLVTARKLLANHWPNETTRKFLTERAIQDEDYRLRKIDLELLTNQWPDETTRKFLTEQATKEDYRLRNTILELLANQWPDKTT